MATLADITTATEVSAFNAFAMATLVEPSWRANQRRIVSPTWPKGSDRRSSVATRTPKTRTEPPNHAHHRVSGSGGSGGGSPDGRR